MKTRRPGLSGLQRRIAEGKAEPISEYEKAQLREIKRIYSERFERKSKS